MERAARSPSSSRPAERIPAVLSLLESAWRRHPDQRLGQLLVNLTGTGPSPLFDVEDTVLLAQLEDFLATGPA